MKLQMVQNALKQKNIKYEYTEEDDCGSLDFMFRGQRRDRLHRRGELCSRRRKQEFHVRFQPVVRLSFYNL